MTAEALRVDVVPVVEANGAPAFRAISTRRPGA
jgi:hypothetical protein